MTAIDRVVVVIPANDEERLVGECLASVETAVRRFAESPGGTEAHVVVALDACTDRTAELVARHPSVSTVVLEERNVGAARAAGVALGIGATSLPQEAVWIANTDADSHVPPHWLVRQVALAREGADAVVGAIRPDPRDLTEQQYRAWLSRARAAAREASARIHGANLGVRASAYSAVGGFAPLALGEDVDLVERLRADGARLAWSEASWVETSARVVGRTPGGYSEYVRQYY